MAKIDALNQYISKKLVVYSLVTAVVVIILLEFYRLFDPIGLVENYILYNLLSILSFIIFPILFSFFIIQQGKFIEMLFNGCIYSLVTWIFWIILIFVYLIVKNFFYSSDTLLLSIDYVIPLIGLFFIIFILGGLIGSILKYLKIG
jgi:hypothetical protein